MTTLRRLPGHGVPSHRTLLRRPLSCRPRLPPQRAALGRECGALRCGTLAEEEEEQEEEAEEGKEANEKNEGGRITP